MGNWVYLVIGVLFFGWSLAGVVFPSVASTSATKWPARRVLQLGIAVVCGLYVFVIAKELNWELFLLGHPELKP